MSYRDHNLYDPDDSEFSSRLGRVQLRRPSHHRTSRKLLLAAALAVTAFFAGIWPQATLPTTIVKAVFCLLAAVLVTCALMPLVYLIFRARIGQREVNDDDFFLSQALIDIGGELTLLLAMLIWKIFPLRLRLKAPSHHSHRQIVHLKLDLRSYSFQFDMVVCFLADFLEFLGVTASEEFQGKTIRVESRSTDVLVFCFGDEKRAFCSNFQPVSSYKAQVVSTSPLILACDIGKEVTVILEVGNED